MLVNKHDKHDKHDKRDKRDKRSRHGKHDKQLLYLSGLLLAYACCQFYITWLLSLIPKIPPITSEFSRLKLVLHDSATDVEEEIIDIKRTDQVSPFQLQLLPLFPLAPGFPIPMTNVHLVFL